MSSQAAWYEVVELLGEGGMGRVYRAFHQPTGMPVALKTLRSEVRADAMRRRLLLDEATAAAKIDHPNVARLLDVGREPDGSPFLVMELAGGTPLDAWLERWPGWHRFAPALLELLEGLAAAHAAGVVHCDLKPPNVMVEATSGRTRILDFGVARQLDPLRGSGPDRVAGTPEFMPPEQLSGEGPVGPWSDLYAFGVILAHVVRGRSPFTHLDVIPALFAEKLAHGPQEQPATREGLRVPAALQALIDRLLAPSVRARPRFAAEVARELAELAGGVDDEVDRVSTPDVGGLVSAAITSVDVRLTEERAKDDSEHRARPSAVLTISPEELASAGPDAAPREAPSIDRMTADPPSASEIVLPARLPAGDALALGRLREVPLVGRDEERAELEAMIADVIGSRRARLLAYVGEAGIGKSRLARWGMAHVEREGLMESAAGGYDLSGVDVAGGLRHVLLRLLGTSSPAAWRWIASEPGVDVDALAAFVRADETRATLAQDRVVALAHAVLRAVARARPIYLWLDDVAWATDGALSLVERLLEEGDVPVLVVATLRSGTMQHSALRDRLARALRHPAARVRDVARLGTTERGALFDGALPLAPGVARAIAHRIDGPPLLLVQLVHDWVASGSLVSTEQGWAPPEGTTIDQLLSERPLRALVAARIDGFLAELGSQGPTAEAILVRAALLGARFELSAMRAACASAPGLAAAVDDVMDRALLSGLVRSERGRVYAFDHGLVQEALAERAERVRGALVDAANGLRARYGKERADIGALVAGLLHRAGDRERAWERQVRAIDRAAWVNDDAAAQQYVATARAWLADDPDQEALLEYATARTHYFAYRLDEALACLARGRALATARGDTTLALKCDAAEADVTYYQDRFGDAERIARRVEASASFDDPDLATIGMMATQRLAEVAALRDDLDGAETWRRRTVEYAETTSNEWRTRVAKLNLAELLIVRGHYDEARELCARVLAEARAARAEDEVTAAIESEAKIDVMVGDAERVRDFFAARVVAVESARDGWRLTGLLVWDALAAPDDATLAAGARRFLDAFAAVSHDDSITALAMRALAGRLDDAGKFELAREIDALLESRRALYRKALA